MDIVLRRRRESEDVERGNGGGANGDAGGRPEGVMAARGLAVGVRDGGIELLIALLDSRVDKIGEVERNGGGGGMDMVCG